jgi:hypothetical protein
MDVEDGEGATLEDPTDSADEGTESSATAAPRSARDSWPGGICHVALYKANDMSQ